MLFHTACGQGENGPNLQEALLNGAVNRPLFIKPYKPSHALGHNHGKTRDLTPACLNQEVRASTACPQTDPTRWAALGEDSALDDFKTNLLYSFLLLQYKQQRACFLQPLEAARLVVVVAMNIRWMIHSHSSGTRGKCCQQLGLFLIFSAQQPTYSSIF